MKSKKSWREKLADSKDLPKVVNMRGKGSKETLIIPAPIEVDEMMRRVPKRKLTTVNEIRSALAKKHGTTAACPMTTGIFAWISAWASAESLDEGKKRVTPYWRTLKTGGELNPKYPGGLEGQMARLASEGHDFSVKGKRVFVKDFERFLSNSVR